MVVVRPTYTGTYRGYVLSGITLSSPVLLEVDYYDNYAFAGASPFPAALLKVLDNTGGNQYLWSVTYYDDRAGTLVLEDGTRSRMLFDGGYLR